MIFRFNAWEARPASMGALPTSASWQSTNWSELPWGCLPRSTGRIQRKVAQSVAECNAVDSEHTVESA
eukprot:1370616-Rhodomonas_salina.2